MLTRQLIAEVEAELARCLTRARQLVLRDFPMPEYRLDLRGRTAGLALLKEHCIRLNNAILLRHGAEYIDQVIAHEMAHLLAYRRFGASIRPHGREWRWLMRDVFERKPEVTHAFHARLAHRRVFWYGCDCDEAREFSLTRHRRALNGTRYICRVCKQGMRFQGGQPTDSEQPKGIGGAVHWDDLLKLAHSYLRKAEQPSPRKEPETLQQGKPVQLSLFHENTG